MTVRELRNWLADFPGDNEVKANYYETPNVVELEVTRDDTVCTIGIE